MPRLTSCHQNAKTICAQVDFTIEVERSLKVLFFFMCSYFTCSQRAARLATSKYMLYGLPRLDGGWLGDLVRSMRP